MMTTEAALEIPTWLDRRGKPGHLPVNGEIPIDEIKVGDRYRKDLGDIGPLVNSIRKIGLIHPVVINGSNELIAGERRLEAFKRLGRTSIPFRVIDVPSMLQAEHDENEIRKSFTLTERAAIADALEKVIENQQGKRTDLDPAFVQGVKKTSAEERAKATSAPRGQSRKGAKVAKAAGFTSRQQRDRVKNVIANGTPALAEKMDAGEIDPTTADKIAKHPANKQTEMLAENATKGKARPKKRTRAEVARQKFKSGALAVISGFTRSAPAIKVPALSAEEATEALQLIDAAMIALEDLRRDVEKHKVPGGES